MGFSLSGLTSNPIVSPLGAAYDQGKDDQDGWYGVGGTLGDLLQFQSNEGQNVWQGIQDDPSRILVGSGDPLSTKFWNALLQKENRPLVDQWGGPTSYDYKTAQDRGIDNQDNAHAHAIAHAVAAYFAGGAAGSGGWLANLGKGLGGQAMGNGGNEWLNDDMMNGYVNPNTPNRPRFVQGSNGEYTPPPRGAPSGTTSGASRFNLNGDEDVPLNQGWTLQDVWKRMMA